MRRWVLAGLAGLAAASSAIADSQEAGEKAIKICNQGSRDAGIMCLSLECHRLRHVEILMPTGFRMQLPATVRGYANDD
jgi:hypothetical protein